MPLELFYFVSCSSIFPFRWIFLKFVASIVLYGLTHFLNVFTCASHHGLKSRSIPVHIGRYEPVLADTATIFCRDTESGRYGQNIPKYRFILADMVKI
ncbi:hypothetical protein AAC387_Pa02g0441 [Persea americana]